MGFFWVTNTLSKCMISPEDAFSSKINEPEARLPQTLHWFKWTQAGEFSWTASLTTGLQHLRRWRLQSLPLPSSWRNQMPWFKHGRPLQIFAARSYLAELWLTQRQSINQCSVLFLELNVVWVLLLVVCLVFFFSFALTYSKARNCQIPPLRLNTWKCQCRDLPQRGKPNFSVMEHAYTQSKGVSAAGAKLGDARRSAPGCMSVYVLTVWFLTSPFELHAVANCAVYWYSKWQRESSSSCVCAACRSIGVLVWDFGGEILVGAQTLKCWDLGKAPAFADNSGALDSHQTFDLQLYTVLSDIYFLRDNLFLGAEYNPFRSVFWSFWLKGTVDLNIWVYLSCLSEKRSFVPRTA